MAFALPLKTLTTSFKTLLTPALRSPRPFATAASSVGKTFSYSTLIQEEETMDFSLSFKPLTTSFKPHLTPALRSPGPFATAASSVGVGKTNDSEVDPEPGVKWLVHTNAPFHMSRNEQGFENQRVLSEPLSHQWSLGSIVGGSIAGDVTLGPELTLEKVVFVPGLEENVLSVWALCVSGLEVIFESEVCYFKHGVTGKVIACGFKDERNLYVLDSANLLGVGESVDI